MSNPGAVYEIVERCTFALRQDAGVQAIFGTPPRLESEPDETTEFPYASFAAPQDVPRFAEGFDLSEIFFAWDIWSRESAEEASEGAAAIRDALHLAAPFDTTHYAVVTLTHRVTRGPWRDPDGLTWQAQITFRAFASAL